MMMTLSPGQIPFRGGISSFSIAIVGLGTIAIERFSPQFPNGRSLHSPPVPRARTLITANRSPRGDFPVNYRLRVLLLVVVSAKCLSSVPPFVERRTNRSDVGPISSRCRVYRRKTKSRSFFSERRDDYGPNDIVESCSVWYRDR